MTETKQPTSRRGGGESIREWDAEAYDRISAPQFAWGMRVLERVELLGAEDVMDVGCGSGRLTAEICARVPFGSVLAVDRSSAMVKKARERIGDAQAAIVRYAVASAEEFTAPSPVDVVFSTATLHWVHDHERAFANFFASTKPGGRLVLQCGGAGNLARFHAVVERTMSSDTWARFFRDFAEPWNFATAEGTTARLAGAGWSRVNAWLEDAPTAFETPVAYQEFARKVVLATHCERMPSEELRLRFVEAATAEAARELGGLHLDYVRLNVEAARPA